MTNALSRLEEVLTAEREALLAGALDRLEPITATKAEALETLADHLPADSARLAVLAERLRRNQELCARALDGVRAATARITAVRAARSSLTTYDAGGRAAELAAPRRGLERRA